MAVPSTGTESTDEMLKNAAATQLQCAARKMSARATRTRAFWAWADALLEEEASVRLQRFVRLQAAMQYSQRQDEQEQPGADGRHSEATGTAAGILQRFVRQRSARHTNRLSKVDATQTLLDHAISPFARRPPVSKDTQPKRMPLIVPIAAHDLKNLDLTELEEGYLNVNLVAFKKQLNPPSLRRDSASLSPKQRPVRWAKKKKGGKRSSKRPTSPTSHDAVPKRPSTPMARHASPTGA